MRILSLGAGVQSSALLMACEYRIAKPVDFAVFADTGAEPQEVYIWLAKLQAAVKTPIYIASKGNIAVEVIDHWRGERKRCGQPPLFTLDPAGKKGMLRRHCTSEYKIEVVDKEIRRVLGYKPRQRMRHKIEMVMGISYDEQQRMKVPQEKWKSFDYPLVKAKMGRKECIELVEAFGLGQPPRSACYFCPFKSNTEWSYLKNRHPEDWKKAVEFDRAIRTSVSPNLTSEFFVHSSRVPLDRVKLDEQGEGWSMNDECEGMCGI